MYNWQSASRRLLQETVVFLASSPASSDDADDNHNDNVDALDVDRTFSPFMAVILVLLLSAFFFMAFFSIYIRRSASQQANAPPRNENGPQGVDAAVLEALPLIAYSSAKKRGSSIECAVCLADFEEGEPLCQLPRCRHVFHKSCIKMWLSSHTTCPLCRRSVISDSTRSFTWGVDSGSLRLSLGRWGSRHRSGRSLTGEPSTSPSAPPAGQELQASMAAEHDRIKSDRFSRSHSTGHSIVRQSQSVAWRAAMAEPEQSLDVSAIERVLQESPADGSLQRSRSFAASAEGRWAQMRIGGWVREAGASFKRVLSGKKVGSAAAFGPAASSAGACNPISPV